MSKVTAPAMLTREAIPDAPDEQWIDTMLENTNSFQDQVRTVLQNGFSIGDNTPWKFQDYNLKHGIETEIKNPFDDPAMAIKGIFITRSVGITLDSTGKPDGGTYSIAQPILQWRPSGKPSGSVFVTVQYAPPLGQGYFSAFGAAAANTTNTWRSVASVLVPAGEWDLVGQVEFGGAPTGFSSVIVAVTATTPPTAPNPGVFGDNLLQSNTPPSGLGDNPSTTIAGYKQLLTAPTTFHVASFGLFTGGTLTSRGRISARQFAPDPATTARNTLLFVGA